MNLVSPNILPEIIIARPLFEQTWVGLRHRGDAKTEAVAIWGGSRKGAVSTVNRIYFVADLPNVTAKRLSHRVPRDSMNKLLQQMKDDGSMIIADVHTHPGKWVDLSPVDEENPTEFRTGFVSVVIPDLGLGLPDASVLGVHIYQGNGAWKRATPGSRCLKII